MSHEDEKDASLLLDHNYDGIQELDYPLPRWWVNLFYITIVFGVLYAAYYMVGPGPSSRQELSAQMESVEKARASSKKPEDDRDANFAAALADQGKIELGASVYAGKCAACHGDKGQGVIGPNLTDDYWIHGDGTPGEVAKVISAGVADKGMPPWSEILKSDELINLVAYVKSIRGSNPNGAKDPQGDLRTH